MRCGVVIFPGSNCDHDVEHALALVTGEPPARLWHEEDSVDGCDLVVLPGGFSYGDYLRAGSMAAVSPVMAAVRRLAENGGMVLGICNGFQILLEAGLLPGAMRRNRELRFLSQDVCLRVERNDLPFTAGYRVGQVLRMPIAHAEGNYAASESDLDRLETENQVVFRYCSPEGELGAPWNPNGSERSIAGIASQSGNVCGLMPHPERAAEPVLGNRDGLDLFAGAVAGAGQLLAESVG